MKWRHFQLPPPEDAPLRAADPLVQHTLRSLSRRRLGKDPVGGAPELPPLDEGWIPEPGLAELPSHVCSAGEVRELLLEPARAELLARFEQLVSDLLVGTPGTSGESGTI